MQQAAASTFILITAYKDVNSTFYFDDYNFYKYALNTYKKLFFDTCAKYFSRANHHL